MDMCSFIFFTVEPGAVFLDFLFLVFFGSFNARDSSVLESAQPMRGFFITCDLPCKFSSFLLLVSCVSRILFCSTSTSLRSASSNFSSGLSWYHVTDSRSKCLSQNGFLGSGLIVIFILLVIKVYWFFSQNELETEIYSWSFDNIFLIDTKLS